MKRHIAMLIVICCMSWLSPVWAQAKRLAEPVMVDNFEDGDLASSEAGNWIAVLDCDEGGSSQGTAAIVDEGYRSKHAVRFTYKQGKRYLHKDTGEAKDPFVLLGLMMGEQFSETRDLSSYEGIGFQVKGRGVFTVIMVILNNGKMELWHHLFEVAETTWQKTALPFDEFDLLGKTAQDSKPEPDLQSVALIAISQRNQESPGQGMFLVDDFVFLVPADQSVVGAEPIQFGKLTIHRPSRQWVWEPAKETSKLSWKQKGTTIFFIALPMINKWRIPFSDGLSADPGNQKELMKCTCYELGKFGFRNLNSQGTDKVGLKNFTATRFTFSAEITPARAEQLNLAGIKSSAVFLQVDFIKHLSTTYEIITILPEASRKEALPIASQIIYHLAK